MNSINDLRSIPVHGKIYPNKILPGEDMKKLESRRKFLKGSALAATATAGTLAAPAIVKAAPTVLKMQAAWGLSLIHI